jgi:hypothetical protein
MVGLLLLLQLAPLLVMCWSNAGSAFSDSGPSTFSALSRPPGEASAPWKDWWRTIAGWLLLLLGDAPEGKS